MIWYIVIPSVWSRRLMSYGFHCERSQTVWASRFLTVMIWCIDVWSWINDVLSGYPHDCSSWWSALTIQSEFSPLDPVNQTGEKQSHHRELTLLSKPWSELSPNPPPAPRPQHPPFSYLLYLGFIIDVKNIVESKALFQVYSDFRQFEVQQTAKWKHKKYFIFLQCSLKYLQQPCFT